MGTAGETRPRQRSMEDLGWRPMSYGGATGLRQVSQRHGENSYNVATLPLNATKTKQLYTIKEVGYLLQTVSSQIRFLIVSHSEILCVCLL